MKKYIMIMSFLVFAVLSPLFPQVSGVTVPGSPYCGPWCWEYSLMTKFSGNSLTPQFTAKLNFIEFHIGAGFAGTAEDISATVEKYKTIDSLEYLAEIDSYALDLQVYFIQPEIGARFFFLPNSAASPYLDLTAFWAIPIFSSDYNEKFVHLDSTGTVTGIVAFGSEGEPSTTIAGLYQLGLDIGFGVRYRANENIALYGELAAQGIFMGANIKYDYILERQFTQFIGEEHNWRGEGDIWGLMLGGKLGVQFFF